MTRPYEPDGHHDDPSNWGTRVIVVMDRNPDHSDELSVYIGGKRVDAKVMTYHSEDDHGEILGRYIRVWRNEYGTPEDWELELPDVWPADVWQAMVESEDTLLVKLSTGGTLR